MKLYPLLLSVLLFQCTSSDSIEKNEFKTDTLCYNFQFENKKINFVYNYKHNLSQLTDKKLRREEMKIKNNIDLDVEKCNRCQDYNIYLYPYYNIYYVDIAKFDEIVLFHCMTTDGLTKKYIHDHSFEKKIKLLYPDAKIMNNSIRETTDYYEDNIEFLRAYFENARIKFIYSNFKKVTYKSDWSYIKTMYVKKGLKRDEIWSTAQTFKTNNSFRIIDSIPIAAQ